MTIYEQAMALPKNFKRCYHTHPPLPLGDRVVYGGSCISPVVEDADIYVGLDMGMRSHREKFPWRQGHAFLFRIPDGQPPKDPAEFKLMVKWLAKQVEAGKKVHVGCIGGHGRTGLVLAALARVMIDEKDAIAYVRKNYCHKVVETTAQVNFLAKHWGIAKADPSKPPVVSVSDWGGSKAISGGSMAKASQRARRIDHVRTKGDLWGSHRSRTGKDLV